MKEIGICNNLYKYLIAIRNNMLVSFEKESPIPVMVRIFFFLKTQDINLEKILGLRLNVRKILGFNFIVK